MIGQRLAHYEILELLGKGGMGEVYRAHDGKLGRDVALKLLPPEFAADAERVARFRREAGLVARLNHPGIITIHSIDEADGKLFFTMELVEGQSLDALLSRGGLPAERAIVLGERIADALAAAHDAGLVHRDLKPANILVLPDDRPKILDFGLAKESGAIEGLSADDPTRVVTGDSRLVGTVPYMAPEQVEGGDVDALSDIWATGVVLFEMLAGRRPFLGDNAAATMSSILRDAPPDLATLRPGLPPALGSLVGECLQRDPRNRPGSTRELHRRLRAMRQPSGSDVSGLPTAPRHRRRWPWALAALLAVAAAGGLFALRGWAPGGERAIRALAVLPFESSGDEATAYLGDALTDRLINQLSRLDDMRVMARSTVFRVDRSDPVAAGRELGVDAVVVGRLHSVGEQLSVGVELVRVADGTQAWGNRFEQPRGELLELEQALARGIAGELRAELSGEDQASFSNRPTDDAEAWRLYLRGRQNWYQREPAALLEGVGQLSAAVRRDPDFALAHAALSQAHSVSWQYYPVDIDESRRVAGEHAQRALALDPQLSEAHTAMAIVCFERDWDWDAAERNYLRAIALDPNNMTARQWYGEFLTSMRRFEEAYESFEAGLRIDPLSPVLRIAYAWSLMAGGEIDRAHAVLDPTLQSDPGNWIGLIYKVTLLISGPPDDPRRERLWEFTVRFAEADGWSDAQRETVRQLYEEHGPDGIRLGLAEIDRERGAGVLGPSGQLFLILGLAATGQVDEAVALSLELFEQKHPLLIWVFVDPAMQALQDDPRVRHIRDALVH